MLAALGLWGAIARLGRGRGQLGGGTLPRSDLASVTIDIGPGKIPARCWPNGCGGESRRSWAIFRAEGLNSICGPSSPEEDEEVVRGLSAILREPLVTANRKAQ